MEAPFLGSANSKSEHCHSVILSVMAYPCVRTLVFLHWISFIDTLAEATGHRSWIPSRKPCDSILLLWSTATPQSLSHPSDSLRSCLSVLVFHRSSTAAALCRSSTAHYRLSDYHSLLQNGITSPAIINLRLECLFVAG